MVDKVDSSIEMVTDDFLLDDIEDLPAFITFPTGAYHVRLVEGIVPKTVPMKEIETPCLECAMTLVEVASLDEELKEGETAPKPGDVASVLWQRTNKFAMGNFKEFTAPIAKHVNASTVGEVLGASKGIELLIVVKRVYAKEADRYNMRFKKVEVI